MSHFNISPLVLQQLQTAHELNLVMADLVKFLATGYKTMLRPLSPVARPHVFNKDLRTTKFNTEEQSTESKAQPQKSECSDTKWMQVNDGVKPSSPNIVCDTSLAKAVSNRYEIFSDDTHEIETVLDAENRTKEMQELKKDIKRVSESYDVEAITVDTLEQLLHEMDAEHSKTLEGQVKQIRKLRIDAAAECKKKKENEEMHKKACKRLESARKASKEREVEWKAEAASMQEVIDEGATEVIELKRKVTKLQQEKEQGAMDAINLNVQVGDWKSKYKEKEIAYIKLNDECKKYEKKTEELNKKLEHSNDLMEFMMIPKLSKEAAAMKEIAGKKRNMKKRR